MRAGIFKCLLHFLEKHPSKFTAGLVIQILFSETAKAFRKKGRCVIFSKNALQIYAGFTKECMAETADRRRLYILAYRLGRKIRKITGFTEQHELSSLVFWLYRNIGITMTGSIPGEVIVSDCYFANVYSKEECSVMSAMDAGIIAGICGSGKLDFYERITEGCGQCTACVRKRKER